jgi:hypothetical protein
MIATFAQHVTISAAILGATGDHAELSAVAGVAARLVRGRGQ